LKWNPYKRNKIIQKHEGPSTSSLKPCHTKVQCLVWENLTESPSGFLWLGGTGSSEFDALRTNGGIFLSVGYKRSFTLSANASECSHRNCWYFQARSQNCEKRQFSSSCLSAWKTSALIGRFFVKSDILIFFENLSRKLFSLKSEKNNGHITWRPIHISHHNSLSCS